MANVLTRRVFSRSVFKFMNITKITKQSRCASILLINHHTWSTSLFGHNHLASKRLPSLENVQIQFYSLDQRKNDDEKKLSLFQKFKQMYKEYWYVLVPVHLITSAAWFGGFYYLAKSGVDIPALLESLNISEKITHTLRDSSMGYLAVAYALYKIATPARYTVTVAGTTVSINYLKKWGYIKPVPSRERLKEMYYEQKDNIMETMRETKEGIKDKKENIIEGLKDKKENIIEGFKDKKENIFEDIDKSIKQIKELGEKVKQKEHIGERVSKEQKHKDKDKV